MDDTAIDARLRALLAAPDPEPDLAFVARVDRVVAIEQALTAARSRAWRRFAREALASGALAGALAVLWRFVGDLPAAAAPTGFAFGPAAAGLAALLLWQVVEMRVAR